MAKTETSNNLKHGPDLFSDVVPIASSLRPQIVGKLNREFFQSQFNQAFEDANISLTGLIRAYFPDMKISKDNIQEILWKHFENKKHTFIEYYTEVDPQIVKDWYRDYCIYLLALAREYESPVERVAKALSRDYHLMDAKQVALEGREISLIQFLQEIELESCEAIQRKIELITTQAATASLAERPKKISAPASTRVKLSEEESQILEFFISDFNEIQSKTPPPATSQMLSNIYRYLLDSHHIRDLPKLLHFYGSQGLNGNPKLVELLLSVITNDSSFGYYAEPALNYNEYFAQFTFSFLALIQATGVQAALSNSARSIGLSNYAQSLFDDHELKQNADLEHYLNAQNFTREELIALGALASLERKDYIEELQKDNKWQVGLTDRVIDEALSAYLAKKNSLDILDRLKQLELLTNRIIKPQKEDLVDLFERAKSVSLKHARPLIGAPELLVWADLRGCSLPSQIVQYIYFLEYDKHIYTSHKDYLTHLLKDKLQKRDLNKLGVWEFMQLTLEPPSVFTAHKVWVSEITKKLIESNGAAELARIHKELSIASNHPITLASTLEHASTDANIEVLTHELTAAYNKWLINWQLNSADDLRYLERIFEQALAIDPDTAQFNYINVVNFKYARGYNTAPTDLQKRAQNFVDAMEFIAERSGILPAHQIVATGFQTMIASDQLFAELYWASSKIFDCQLSPEQARDHCTKILNHYVKNLISDYEYGDLPDVAALYYYKAIIAGSGITPFSQAELQNICKEIAGLTSDHQKKIQIMMEQLGASLDQEFIEQYMLHNPSFIQPTSFNLPEIVLSNHLAEAKNLTLNEYKRVLTVFSCSNLFLSLIENTKADGQINSKRLILLRAALVGQGDSQYLSESSKYPEIKQALLDQIEFHTLHPRKGFSKLICECFPYVNDKEPIIETMQEIFDRFLSDKTRDKPDASEIIATRLLTRWDYSDQATARFLKACSEERIDTRFRIALLGKVKSRGMGWKDPLLPVLEGILDSQSKLQLADLKLLVALDSIPSAHVRNTIQALAPKVLTAIAANNKSPHLMNSQEYPNIRAAGFLLAQHVTDGAVNLLSAINQFYGKLNSTSNIQRLEYGLAGMAHMPHDITAKFLTSIFNCHNFDNEHQFYIVSDCLRAFAAVYLVEKSIYDSNSDNQIPFEKSFSLQLQNSISKEINELAQLNEAIKYWLINNLRELLPHPNIESRHLDLISTHWDSLEPIFTYAAKQRGASLNPRPKYWRPALHKAVLTYFADLVTHFDPPDYQGWKTFRYDLKRDSVQVQIGQLSQEQLELWKADYYIELGDLAHLQKGVERGEMIASQLAIGIAHGHFGNTFNSPEGQRIIEVAQNLQDQNKNTRQKDAPALFTDIEHAKTIAEIKVSLPGAHKAKKAINDLRVNQFLSINTKLNGRIKAIAQYLEPDEYSKISIALKALREARQSKVERKQILPDQLLEGIARLAETDIEQAHNLGINFEQLQKQGLKTIYADYERLTALTEICRFFVLDESHIRAGQHVLGNQTYDLLSSLALIRRFLSEQVGAEPYLQAISDQLKTNFEGFEGKRFAMVISDDPEILMQVGKFPLGNSSCQNYEGQAGYNITLPSIIGDAHQRALFLIDVNKLPKSECDKIDKQGFKVIGPTISAKDLLKASFARELIKLSPDEGVYLEPTYSKLGINDSGTISVFNTFVDIVFAKPMNHKIFRVGNEHQVSIPASNNPAGQYEDGSIVSDKIKRGIIKGDYQLNARIVNSSQDITESDLDLSGSIRSETEVFMH